MLEYAKTGAPGLGAQGRGVGEQPRGIAGLSGTPTRMFREFAGASTLPANSRNILDGGCNLSRISQRIHWESVVRAGHCQACTDCNGPHRCLSCWCCSRPVPSARRAACARASCGPGLLPGLRIDTRWQGVLSRRRQVTAEDRQLALGHSQRTLAGQTCHHGNPAGTGWRSWRAGCGPGPDYQALGQPPRALARPRSCGRLPEGPGACWGAPGPLSRLLGPARPHWPPARPRCLGSSWGRPWATPRLRAVLGPAGGLHACKALGQGSHCSLSCARQAHDVRHDARE